MARQKAMGIVPQETRLPARNDGVKAWDEHSADEQRVFTRLQAAFAGMLDHADQHLARLIAFLDTAGIRDNTLILVLSDNGASQEGGPLGFVNAMGPYNFRPEPMAEKLRRIDDIGGPDSHSNFPHGWAMASNTPLRRYKQNTHGGGIRDPFVMTWPKKIAAQGRGAPSVRPCLRPDADLARPDRHHAAGEIGGVAQMPIEGESFARSIADPAGAVESRRRNISRCSAIAASGRTAGRRSRSIPRARRSRTTNGSCFTSRRISRKPTISPSSEPERLEAMIKLWWSEAEKHNVLPLDDRFGPRFAENAARFHGARNKFTFHAGMGHVPTDVAPDVRSRSYTIEAHVEIADGWRRGRADRPWRCDVGLQPLHQGRPAGARPQHRRRP